MKNNKKSEYNVFAKKFSETRNYAWEEFKFFMPYIKKGDRILDLGCGNGRLRKFLDEKIVLSGSYFGFDLSEKLLNIARKSFPRDGFFKGNFGKSLPFGANNFDWVISIAAFHHLLDVKSQQKFLSESLRVLKPGGKIFLTTWVLPQKYFWMNFWRGRVFSKNWIVPFGKEKHLRTYRNVNEKDLEKLLKNAGFKVLKVEKFKNRNYIILAEKLKLDVK